MVNLFLKNWKHLKKPKANGSLGFQHVQCTNESLFLKVRMGDAMPTNGSLGWSWSIVNGSSVRIFEDRWVLFSNLSDFLGRRRSG